MTKSDELEALRKHGLKLKKEIRSVNGELNRALRAVAAGRRGRSMQVLETRFEDYADLKFELGRVTGEILQLRMHIREQEQRGWDVDRLEGDWQEQALKEDRLSWLQLKEQRSSVAPSEEREWQGPDPYHR